MGSHTFDSYNAMTELFGSPPLMVNGTVLTLEHVMQRLEMIENKVAMVELVENFDRKIHNEITPYGFKVGVILNFFKEKEPIVKEKIDQDSTRIDKLEDIITNVGSALSAIKTTPNTSTTKLSKFMYVPKDKGETSSKGIADLKSISVHPNFLTFARDPFDTLDFLDFLPKSLIINRDKEVPKNHKFLIKELPSKDGNT